MADNSLPSGDAGADVVENVADSSATTPAQPKVPRYYSPYQVNPVVHSRSYVSSVISSQETMLESLRFLRRQLDLEDREISKIQKDIYQNLYPNKWTNYRLQQGKEED